MSPEDRGTEPPPDPPKQRADPDRLGTRGFTREVPAEPAQIGGLRHEVLAFAAAHNAPADVRDDIAIAVSEACANVVMHAYAGDPRPGPLTVQTYYDNGQLVVIVTDEGGGLLTRSDNPGTGLGLSLMRRLTQRLEITDHSPAGTKVLMRFAIAG